MQSRRMSFIEAKANAIIGLLVSWLFTYLCLPLFGLEPSMLEATWITVCYFVLSMARSYVLRRVFVTLEGRE
ncbi:MAG: DUF7220 family protein [Alphaproteobacteria bacterium]